MESSEDHNQYSLQEIFNELNRLPSDDVSCRIELCQQALEMVSKENNPDIWGKLHDDIGCSLLELKVSSRAENIEQAIIYFNQALEVRTCKEHPVEWAMTQNNLATAYKDRVYSNPSENIQKAIQHYKLALTVRTCKDLPNEWAVTQGNLAKAYVKRTHGGRAENLEQAIQCFEQVLEVRVRQGNLKECASIWNELAKVYMERSSGDPVKNIEQAIHYCEQALEVYTSDADPEEWAQARNNLGNAYWARVHNERTKNIEHVAYSCEQAKNIEKAVFNYELALKVRDREAYPEGWAETLSNLANIELDRETEEDTKKAIEHLLQVLTVYTRERSPRYWARTNNNLAIAYSGLKKGGRYEKVEEAIFHYQQALEIYHPDSFSDRCLYAARALGNLAFDEQLWGLAKQSYTTTFEAQDILMQSVFSPVSEKAELSEAQNLPPRAAYAHYKSGDVRQAVEVLEKGRAQLLRGSFELQQQSLNRLRVSGYEHLYNNYIQARDAYKSLDGVDPTAALEKLQAAVSAIREEAGQKYPEYRHFLKSLTCKEIQELAQEKAIVYLISTHAGGLALIVGKAEVQAVEMPALEQEALQKQIWPPTNEEIATLNKHLALGEITTEDIQVVNGGYFSIYALWNARHVLVNTPDDQMKELFDAWEKTLNTTTQWLWKTMNMEELIPAIKEQGNSAILIPAGQLALLPLHAAWTDSTESGKRRYMLDDLDVSYVPSAHALWRANLAATNPMDKLMLVSKQDALLKFSEDEERVVLNTYEHAVHLPGKKATRKAVQREMQKAHILHFSTHGHAGWEKAENACLKLTDGELTLADIFTLDLHQARLAILSACETGMPGFELIDEMFGLPAGMMQAGIPGVIGSLWPVNDGSTALLMSGFYKFWRKDGKTPQEALKLAQKWLRDSGFESPYHWAAFTYTGI